MSRLPLGRSIPALALVALLAALALPATALGLTSIEGLITGPGPVEEVEVCLVEAKPSEFCTYPDASGEYALVGMVPGVYQVEFRPSYRSHLVAQYYNHKARLSEANKIVVAQNLVVNQVDAALELGGEIEGRATDALSGLGVEEVEVCAQDAVSGAAVSCTHTDADGEYALPSVPPGSYRVGFWGERQSAAYAPQFFDEERSLFEATNVAVAAGATIPGIDAQLRVGARVAGTVSDAATGLPLAGIAVCLLRASAAGPERCAFSGPGGGYTLPGVASGSYQVAFSPEFNEFAVEEFVLPEEDGWHTQYYEGSPTRAGSTALALSAPQARGGVDAALLSTFSPPPPVPPPPAPDLAVPAPPVLPQPVEKAKPKKCRKGYVKRRVKGKVRCVKAQRRHHR